MSDEEMKLILSAYSHEDYYSVLSVEDRHTATDKDIKQAYRRQSLIWHPDKREDGEEAFRAIQEAYDILSDPDKRRQCDSDAPFDDSIPEETLDDMSLFYKIFGTCFRRNAMWHKGGTDKVPNLGDEATPIKDVHRFYKFWASEFVSWRVFKHKDAHELDEAEDRSERRWMMKENSKLAKDLVRKEQSRLMTLVERARKLDPRLRAEREARLQRKKEKQEEAAKRKKEEEEARLQAEESAKQAEAEIKMQERKAVQAEEKRKRKLTKALRALATDSNLSAEHVELLMMSLGHEDMEALLEKCADAPDVTGILRAEVQSVKDKRKEVLAQQKLRKKKEADEREAIAQELENEPDWSVGELGLLSTALNNIPGGVTDRWTRVMKELSRADSAWSRSLPSVRRKAVALKKGLVGPGKRRQKKKEVTIKSPASVNYRFMLSAEDAEEEIWTKKQQKQLETGIKAHGKTEWRLIAEGVDGKSADQCYHRFQKLMKDVRARKMKAAALTAPDWNDTDQKLLESAMRATGRDAEGSFDWAEVSKLVEGHSKESCEARFLYLREQVAKKKAKKKGKK